MAAEAAGLQARLSELEGQLSAVERSLALSEEVRVVLLNQYHYNLYFCFILLYFEQINEESLANASRAVVEVGVGGKTKGPRQRSPL